MVVYSFSILHSSGSLGFPVLGIYTRPYKASSMLPSHRITSPSLSMPSRLSRMSLPPNIPAAPAAVPPPFAQTSWNLTVWSLDAIIMQPSLADFGLLRRREPEEPQGYGIAYKARSSPSHGMAATCLQSGQLKTAIRYG